MEIGIITIVGEFINGVGFPVAVCIALFWSNHENAKNHHRVLCEFKDVLKDNTEALKTLSEKVDNK